MGAALRAVGRTMPVVLVVLLGASVAAAIWLSPPRLPVLLLGAIHGAVLLLRPSWVPGLLVLDLALVAWETAMKAPAFFAVNLDVWMHLAYIRKILESGPIPPDAFYQGHTASPILSLTHYVQAGLAAISGASIDQAWLWSQPFAVVLLGLCVYFCHSELFRDRRKALVATLFSLAWAAPTWSYTSYPRSFAAIFYFLALGLLWRALRERARWAALAAGGALGLAIDSHPVSGVFFALVIASAMLAIGLHRQLVKGPSIIAPLVLVVLGALATATPWIVADTLAFSSKIATAPIQHAPHPDLTDFLRIELAMLAPSDGPNARLGGALLVWLAPATLGAVRLLRSPRDPIQTAYIAGACLVFVTLVASPATSAMVDLFGARYLARSFQILPLAALVALAISWPSARDGETRRSRVPGALVISLYVCVCLRGLGSSGLPPSASLPDDVEELRDERLEPVIHGRVVLAHKKTAYLIPYLTGAYVAWNAEDHTNPWLFDPERHRVAQQILRGAASPAQVERFCTRYGVDFALFRDESLPAEALLLGSGLFRRRLAIPGYVLLERVVEPE